MFFFLIELIQISLQGLAYFRGWNLTDFAQFWAFSLLYYTTVFELEEKELYVPQLEFFMIVLIFIKMISFSRIIESYGYLIHMVVLTLQELFPFLTAFVIVTVFFAVTLMVLRVDIDHDIADVKGPGISSEIGLLILQSYRLTIGEIGVPQYKQLTEHEQSGWINLQIILIWFVWFL